MLVCSNSTKTVDISFESKLVLGSRERSSMCVTHYRKRNVGLSSGFPRFSSCRGHSQIAGFGGCLSHL